MIDTGKDNQILPKSAASRSKECAAQANQNCVRQYISGKHLLLIGFVQNLPVR
jgi:hypothetical protein